MSVVPSKTHSSIYSSFQQTSGSEAFHQQSVQEFNAHAPCPADQLQARTVLLHRSSGPLQLCTWLARRRWPLRWRVDEERPPRRAAHPFAVHPAGQWRVPRGRQADAGDDRILRNGCEGHARDQQSHARYVR